MSPLPRDPRLVPDYLRSLKEQMLRRGLRPDETPTMADYEREATRRGLYTPFKTFHDYVTIINSGPPALLSYEHVPTLVDVCQRFVDGAITRLLVMLPPRYFKTELFGRLLTAYY